MRRILIGAALLAGAAGTASAQTRCIDPLDLQVLVRKYLAREPWPSLDAAMTMFDGTCSRDRLTARLADRLGGVAGYKAGLTNPAVQKRFNHGAPVRGTLFAQMLLRDGGSGVEVPAQFGARPLFEADLVVEVADSGIHDASDPLQVLNHIARIYPFIELPDLVVEDPARLSGPQIVAINVGARLGVLGVAVVNDGSADLVMRLADMTVKLVDDKGVVLDQGKGAAILDNPLNAVLWLAQDLKNAGITLKKGDLLSLGSFTRLLPPKSGQTVTAVYEGLPGADGKDARVTVRFK